MTRATSAVLVLVLVALAAVVVGATRLVAGDRAELAERFGAERARVVGEAAREIGGDLDEVSATMREAARLLSDPSTAEAPERELRALRAAVAQYRLLVVYDAEGHARHEVGARPGRGGDERDRDGASPDEAKAVEAALARASRLALESKRPEAVSIAAASHRAWWRVFGTAIRRPRDEAAAAGLGAPGVGAESARPLGALVVLLDTQRLYDRLHLLASDGLRVLLLGGPGEPTAASDPDSAAAIERADDGKVVAPRFAELLARMRRGEAGTIAIDEREAARLGLSGGPFVAAFHAIAAGSAPGWSVASLSSTGALRAHEQAIVRRLSAAAGAVAILLLAFGGFLVVASRRQVALRERLRHADEIRHLHEKTDKILDNIPTGVMALADDGRITAVNRALREKLPESVLGQPLAAAFPDAPSATVQRLSSLIEAARAAGRVRSVPGERMALFGEEGQYSLHAVPLESGLPDARVLLVVEDVSEVRQLAGQLLRAEKLATIGVLSAGIAHEIGTPLGVVRGRAEYIHGKLGPGHPQSQGLAVIVEQIDRVSRIIRQLLDFARVKPAAVRPVGVGPVARTVAELLRYEAERRKLELTVRVPDELLRVMADPDQLQQVLVNLAMNALDACRAGGHVAIEAEEAPPPPGESAFQRVRIVVRDDGCGIDDELKAQIFDPFFTTKKRGQGTGLGLTMAADIVRNHGAEIEVESERDRGTRMILLWPAATAADRPAATTTPPPSATGAADTEQAARAGEAGTRVV